jgi:DNA-binding NarL/FixJ family response regulator
MLYRIALVDDQKNILNQLTTELGVYTQLNIVFTAKNGADYLQQMKNLPAVLHPQVVLMDIEMPVMGGIEAVRQSSKLYETIQYIMFTVVDDDKKLFDAIAAGADGYLLKDERADVLFESIVEIIEKKGAPMSPSIARKTLKLLLNPPRIVNNVVSPTNLTSREEQILKSTVAGLNYKQIAEKLELSPFTIRNHITRIYDKLHISSKAEAINLAIKNKWV